MDRTFTPSIRKDIPRRHQFRHMLLTQTPVGKDYFETEELLGSLVGNCVKSELRWALFPPVGPSPRAAWKAPTIKLDSGTPTSVYIIKFEVPLSSGGDFTVFKPGITSKPVVGGGGRYSAKFGPDIIYQKTLTPAQAWASEQKLLMTMLKTPDEYLFEDWIWYWTTYEDMLDALPDSNSQVTIDGKDFLQVKKVRDEVHRLKNERLADRPSFLTSKIIKAKSDHLATTEWRSWPYSPESLIEMADKIVEFSKESYG